jgi:hypothetical protein
MIVLEDFTKAKAGRDLPIEGRVEHCPRCGRSGVEQAFQEGAPILVHSQISQVLGDGMRTEPQDCCALSVASARPEAG